MTDLPEVMREGGYADYTKVRGENALLVAWGLSDAELASYR